MHKPCVFAGAALLWIALIGMVAPVVHAAAPKVDQLFPAGGQAGATVDLEVIGKVEPWPVSVWSSRAGVELTCKEEQGKLTATVAADAEAGLYWFRFYNEQGTSAPVVWLVGNLPEVNEQEPNDDPRKPQTIDSQPVVINGRLQSRGDVDHFAVALEAGATLVADVESHSVLGTPLDATLQIVSHDGFVLSQNDDSNGLDPRIIFVAPQQATYLVRVFGFPADPNSSIALAGGADYVYRLTLTTEGFVDYALPLAIQRHTDTALELFGWNLPDDARQLQLSAASPQTRMFVGHPSTAGGVTLTIEPHACVTEEGLAAAGDAALLQLPVTVTGQIDRAGDRDEYRFAAQAKQVIQFEVQSRGMGYPLEPFLEIVDAAGKSLARAGDRGRERDAVINFTAPADGEYTARVSDLHRDGSPRHVYRLRAHPSTPEVQLSVAADQFTAASGKTLEIAVQVARSGGFDKNVAITVTGLPEGATAEPVTSPAEGDEAKEVKLTIHTGSKPFSGPIRIEGTVEGSSEDAGQLPLRASVAARAMFDGDPWLTVTPAEK